MDVEVEPMISLFRSAYRRAVQITTDARNWLVSTFRSPRFAKIAVEFFTEAAVLVFVFPIPDTLVQFGKSKVTWPLTVGSVVLAVVFLLLAGIISRAEP